jgi:hypothetical protein
MPVITVTAALVEMLVLLVTLGTQVTMVMAVLAEMPAPVIQVMLAIQASADRAAAVAVEAQRGQGTHQQLDLQAIQAVDHLAAPVAAAIT